MLCKLWGLLSSAEALLQIAKLAGLFYATMDLTAETWGCFQPRVRDKLCSFVLERLAFELLLFHPPYLTPSSLDTHWVEVSVFDISKILVVRW